MAKSLIELEDIPDWPTLYPELYSAGQEIRELARQLTQGNTIIPAIFPVPQIQLPNLVYDLISAREGDRVAAARLSKMVNSTKKPPSNLLTDAIIEVLSNTREGIPVFSKSEGRWLRLRDKEGRSKVLTTGHDLSIEDFWQWFEFEAVKAAEALQKDEPYVAKVIYPLLLPSEPGQLLRVPGRRGRPPKEDEEYHGAYPDPQGFQAAYHKAYIKAKRKWHRPTLVQVGDEMEPTILAERTLRRYLNEIYHLPWPPF